MACLPSGMLSRPDSAAPTSGEPSGARAWPPCARRAESARARRRSTALRSSQSEPLCLCRHRASRNVPDPEDWRALRTTRALHSRGFTVGIYRIPNRSCHEIVSLVVPCSRRNPDCQFSRPRKRKHSRGPCPPTPAPDPAATLAYIHGAWDTLTRSMTDCHSLVDIKVTANPVLYMPAECLRRPRSQRSNRSATSR